MFAFSFFFFLFFFRSYLKFHYGQAAWSIGSVICQIPSSIQCPAVPTGWLGFKTNRKCYIFRSLEKDDRKFEIAKSICNNIDGVKLAKLFTETELLLQFVPVVNKNIEKFEKLILYKEIYYPGFFFDDERISTVENHFGVVVTE